MTEIESQNNLTTVGYGVLNDLGKAIGGNRERQSSDQTFMDAVANSAQNQFDTNAIDNTGPYKAIVLRIETPLGASPEPEAGSWMSTLLGDMWPTPPILVSVKARIPEIHAALPIPEGRGDVDGPHQQVIDMYPTYVAQSTDMTPAPAIDDIIYVDYGNKNTWTDPIIVRYLIGQKPGSGGSSGTGGKDCFKSVGSAGGLSAPSGDALPGANKAVAQSGLPLLPRKAVNVESGEYTFEKGEKGGYVNTVTAWEKAIKAAKIPGKSWLGYLTGNDAPPLLFAAMYGGEGDTEHKSEDNLRDTIIFIPNVTNVSFKEAPVEILVYFHDFNEYDIKSFTEIANAIKKMAEAGRNFVLVMPELPWSSNTNTPNGRTDNGLHEYQIWWRVVLETLTEISGASFEDGSESLFVSVIAKGAGSFIIKNAADKSQFHGTCIQALDILGSDCPNPAQRMIMSFSKGYSYAFINKQAGGGLPNKWLEEIDPNITECAFLVFSSDFFGQALPIEAQPLIMELKSKLDPDKPHNVNNVIIDQYDDNVDITAASLLRWVNLAKAGVKEEEEIAAKKVADATPQTDETAADADNTSVEDASEIPPEPTPPKQPDAQQPPPPDPPTPPSETPKKSATSPKDAATLSPAVVWQENRVRVVDMGGSLVGAAAENLLVKIPDQWTTGSKIRKLHKLAMARVEAIIVSAAAAGITLSVVSAWREHKWKSYESYKAKMIQEYGSLKEGKKMRAFDSPHETGLAVDWGKPSGLEPKSKTISAQKKTKAFAWLQQNAHLFGLTPYKEEPWHWEMKITKEAYITGEEFAVGSPLSYAVRVDSLGSTDAQLPSGPGSGGTGGGGDFDEFAAATCRRRSGGGSGGGGGMAAGDGAPGISFNSVGSPGDVNIVPGPAMPSRNHANGKGYPKRKKQIKMYIIHETGGWPTEDGEKYAFKLGLNNPKSKYAPGGKKEGSMVTYWTAHNGDIVQTAPFTSQCWSGTPCNGISQGNEMGNLVRTDVTRTNKHIKVKGHILIRQDDKGHVRVLPGYEGGGTYRGNSNESFMLDSLAQVEAVWKHIVWISGGAGGMEGSELLNLPIAFPAVMNEDYYWWGRTPVGADPMTWWKATAKDDGFAGGIVSHHNWHHGDGEFGEYYCLARAQGFNPDDAYYTAVGALCSMAGKGKNHTGFGKKATRHPDAEYTQMGRDIMKGAPLTNVWGSLAEEPTWF